MNNLTERYFTSFKGTYYGEIHKMDNVYLDSYANEAAYCEDTRKLREFNYFVYCVCY
ncbi:transposase [Actinobacillus arthritidis]|nr:hypothetical protein [Actinobacillus arthritidis]WGE90204.1 transposase [Actinobacillus arthritidis]